MKGGNILEALVAGIAVLVTIYTIFLTISDSMDSKSEWRKQLYDLSSKKEIGINEIQRLRSSMRFVKKINSKPIKSYSIKSALTFDNMSFMIISFCDYIIENQSELNSDEHIQVDKLTRIFARYLSKNQWETLPKIPFLTKKWIKKESPKIIKEVLHQIENENLDLFLYSTFK